VVVFGVRVAVLICISPSGFGLFDSSVTTELADTVRVLPRGVGWIAPMAEVAVVGGFRINGAAETEMANDFGWAEIKCLMDGFFDAFEANFLGVEGIETDGDGVGMTDGVGELDFHAIGEASSDNVFGDIAAHVGGAAVDFGGVFTAEGATPVAAGSTVGIDDDFAAGQAAIPFGSPDDNATGGVHEEFGAPIEHLFWENFTDEFFDNELLDLAMGDVVAVLSGNHDRGDAEGFVLTVLNGDLSFGVGAEPGDFTRFTNSAEFSSEVVGEHDGGGHKFWGFAAGEAEHESLIARALLGGFLARNAAGIDPLGDIGALASEGVHDVDAVGVKNVFWVGIADGADGGADDGIVVQFGAGGDFSCDDDEIGFYEGFAGDATVRVLGEAGIEHRIGDSVADFVGMAFADRLRRKDKVAFHKSGICHPSARMQE
jgi:hypothetical protein